MSHPKTDFTVQNEGSIILLHPDTEPAIRWVEDNIGQANGYQPYWPTVVIEPRYVRDIIEGIQAEGLTIE